MYRRGGLEAHACGKFTAKCAQIQFTRSESTGAEVRGAGANSVAPPPLFPSAAALLASPFPLAPDKIPGEAAVAEQNTAPPPASQNPEPNAAVPVPVPSHPDGAQNHRRLLHAPRQAPPRGRYRPGERLLLLFTPSSLSPEQRRRGAETNHALARARRNLRLAESKTKASGGAAAKLEELLVEETWVEALDGELRKPYALELCRFVTHERLHGPLPVYPPPHLVFHALNATPFDRVKAVVIGQDPYHGPGQAMGLSFSVPEGIKKPSSLGNIFKELEKDLGCTVPSHGNLERWAVQGVLMLNTVLTVREHQANSHAKKGWEEFTDAVIKTISQKRSGLVFLLWGNSAQSKTRLIDETKHHILKSAHPSGLSANRGFFGCRHFSKTNQILEKLGLSSIDWQL